VPIATSDLSVLWAGLAGHSLAKHLLVNLDDALKLIHGPAELGDGFPEFGAGPGVILRRNLEQIFAEPRRVEGGF